MPWARALALLRKGEMEAVFYSSYSAERTEFGVYPLNNGVADESRASRRSAYHVYAAADSDDTALLNGAEVGGRQIVVERQSSIIPELQRRNAIIVTSAKYLSMLRMVAARRVDAAVGIDKTFDGILAKNPDLLAKITKVDSVIEKKVGYVMFSKPFYGKNSDIAECLWTASATLRDSDWFKEMRSAYGP
jgi:polar amino acid transport system substrate-binding protein